MFNDSTDEFYTTCMIDICKWVCKKQGHVFSCEVNNFGSYGNMYYCKIADSNGDVIQELKWMYLPALVKRVLVYYQIIEDDLIFTPIAKHNE